LNRQIQPVIAALGKRKPETVARSIDKLVKETEIKKLFRNLYPDVGMPFARGQYRELGGKSQKDMDEMVDVWYEEMIRYSQDPKGAGYRISEITVVSQKGAVNIIKNILESQTIPDGLGVEQTARLFKKEFEKYYMDITIGRSRVIAQTEVLSASNKGSFEGAKAMDAKHKVWLTSGNPAPKGQENRHIGYPGLHGQKRGIDEMFDVRGFELMFPGDPQGEPSEVINCHCGLVYEP